MLYWMLKLQLGFYSGTFDDRASMRYRLIQAIGGKYVHVVMVFLDSDTNEYKVSDTREKVGATMQEYKEFERVGWTLNTITIPSSAVMKMYNFCCDVCARGCGYNVIGQYAAATPFPVSGNGTSYFCSEYIVAAFQSAGYLKDMVAEASSPTDIYYGVRQLVTSFDGNPNRDAYVGKMSTAGVSIPDKRYYVQSFRTTVENAFDKFV